MKYITFVTVLAFFLAVQAAHAGQVIQLMQGQTYPLTSGDVVACMGQPAPRPPGPTLYQCSWQVAYGGQGPQSSSLCNAFNSACQSLHMQAAGAVCSTFLNCTDQNGQAASNNGCQ